MNFRFIIRCLGILIFLVIGVMVAPMAISFYDLWHLPNIGNSAVAGAFLLSAAIGMGAGGLFLVWAGGETGKVETREALFLVTLTYVCCGLVSALPFYIWASMLPDELGKTFEFYSFTNSLFESVSGVTTTGASILTDIERLPRAILFWRAIIQWMGGLGIILVFVAVLPWIATGKMKIYKAESSGIGDSGSANIQDTARNLWFVYCFLTLAQIILLLLGDSDLDLFGASTMAFSAMATAGFSIFNQSAGGLTVFNQWVCIIFMFLSGVNYSLYCGLLKKRWSALYKDPELRLYVAIVGFASLAIAIDIYGTSYTSMDGSPADNGAWASLTNGAFQAVSIQTTTGFSNTNSDGFSVFSKMILVTLMFVGGCGGSTGGGLKVVRVMSALKMILHELEKIYRPSVVRPILIGGKPLASKVRQGVLVHIVLVFFLSFVGAMALAVLEPKFDFVTIGTAAVACLNNIGPGFAAVGVTQNYFEFSDPSKFLLLVLMILGRLEVFTVLALFLPRFWGRR